MSTPEPYWVTRDGVPLEVEEACAELDAQHREIERLRDELNAASNAAVGMSTFLANEELVWACETWPWLAGNVEIEDTMQEAGGE